MKFTFALLLLFFFNYGISFSQDILHLDFVVLRNHEIVGTLRATKSILPKKTTYSLTSFVKINALFTLNIKETIHAEYANRVLTSSHHLREINDFKSTEKQLLRVNNEYQFEGKPHAELSDEINASVLTLYFEEPIHQTKIYTESHVKIITMKQMIPGVYTLTLPNKTTAEYHYDNGTLTKVDAYTKWGLITFKRVTPYASK
jgi:hypothetical protein